VSERDLDPRVLRIKRFVEWYRRRFSVDVTPGRKAELSCEMFGEFRTLVFRQLITTPFGDGAWAELFLESGLVDGLIAEGVLQEIDRFWQSRDMLD